MLSGATRGLGGRALAKHLSSSKNESVVLGPSRGIFAPNIELQIAELTRLGSHSRTLTPLYHIHCDPPPGRPFNDVERAEFWERIEREFSFEDRPFASVIHTKNGREHEHRTYLRIKFDGTAIRLDHDYARREKVSRITEFERKEPFTSGAHNRAVLQALKVERPEIADAMSSAGLGDSPKPRAPLSPSNRAQQERTTINRNDIQAIVAEAWSKSDDGLSFQRAIEDQGLILAQGDKVALAIDASGNAHPIARLLASEAKARGQKLPASAVKARMNGLALPTIEQAKALPIPKTQPAQPINGDINVQPQTETIAITIANEVTNPEKANSFETLRDAFKLSGGAEKTRLYDSENTQQYRAGLNFASRPGKSEVERPALASVRIAGHNDPNSGRAKEIIRTKRTNFENFRSEIAFEDELKSLPKKMTKLRELADSFDTKKQAWQRIQADQARIDEILKTNPVARKLDLDPIQAGTKAKGRLSDRLRFLNNEVKIADTKAEKANPANDQNFKNHLVQMLLNLFGYATSAQLEYQKLLQEARSKAIENIALMPTNEDFKQAQATADHHAYKARQTFTKWKETPAVAQAIDDNALNKIANDSTDLNVIRALIAGDAEKARSIIRQSQGPKTTDTGPNYSDDHDSSMKPK